MFDDTIHKLASQLISNCILTSTRLAIAESCTGGLLSGAITSIAGSSQVFDRGYIVYSNESKYSELAVPRRLIETHGAVSEQVVRSMADGALARSQPFADLAIAISGEAGPGTSDMKPVGLVHLATASHVRSKALHQAHSFGNVGREHIRLLAIRAALELLLDCIAKDTQK